MPPMDLAGRCGARAGALRSGRGAAGQRPHQRPLADRLHRIQRMGRADARRHGRSSPTGATASRPRPQLAPPGVEARSWSGCPAARSLDRIAAELAPFASVGFEAAHVTYEQFQRYHRRSSSRHSCRSAGWSRPSAGTRTPARSPAWQRPAASPTRRSPRWRRTARRRVRPRPRCATGWRSACASWVPAGRATRRSWRRDRSTRRAAPPPDRHGHRARAHGHHRRRRARRRLPQRHDPHVRRRRRRRRSSWSSTSSCSPRNVPGWPRWKPGSALPELDVGVPRHHHRGGVRRVVQPRHRPRRRPADPRGSVRQPDRRRSNCRSAT